MAGKGLNWANDILNLLFNGTPIPNIADNAASSPIGLIYIGLYTADPGPGGDQTTNECTYTGYARVGIARTASGWTVSTEGLINPVETIVFPTSTGGATQTAAFVGIGTAASGPGVLLYSGPISPTIVVTNGTEPQLTTATTIGED